MRRLCSSCESRSVYVVSLHRYRARGARQLVENHDLCDRCYRSMRAQIVAARQMPKPLWAYRERSSLVLMDTQAGQA